MTGMMATCHRCGLSRMVNHQSASPLCHDCSYVSTHTSDDWMADGKCRNKKHDAEWWWPQHGNDSCIRVALAICVTCPVRDRCLDYALKHNEREGIWGGLLPTARLRVAVLERERHLPAPAHHDTPDAIATRRRDITA